MKPIYVQHQWVLVLPYMGFEDRAEIWGGGRSQRSATWRWYKFGANARLVLCLRNEVVAPPPDTNPPLDLQSSASLEVSSLVFDDDLRSLKTDFHVGGGGSPHATQAASVGVGGRWADRPLPHPNACSFMFVTNMNENTKPS